MSSLVAFSSAGLGVLFLCALRAVRCALGGVVPFHGFCYGTVDIAVQGLSTGCRVGLYDFFSALVDLEVRPIPSPPIIIITQKTWWVQYVKIAKSYWVHLVRMSMDIVGTVCYYKNVRREHRMTKKVPGVGHRDEEVKRMKYQNGLWWYKGKSFESLHEALLSVWPK